MILVVTHGADVGADLVVRALKTRNAEYLRLNTDELGTPAAHAGFDRNGPALHYRGDTLPASRISAIWFRRFARPAALDAVAQEYRAFAGREMAVALDAFLESAPAFQVNPFEADRLAANRLLQGVRAGKVGLRIPATLVTQQPDEARAFCASFAAVVTKALSSGTLDVAGATAAHTSIVGADSDLEAVAAAPALFQERIPKAHEWRLTTVGDTIFAARTRSAAAVDPVDWRRSQNTVGIFERADPPAAVATMIRALCRASALPFGTHDLIETPAGDFYFLETNPAGQWGWLEVELGLPVSDALAALLIAGRPDEEATDGSVR